MTNTAVAKAAKRYQARGWSVIPIAAGEKRPTMAGWQNGGITAADIETYFNDPNRPHNVSVLLGSHSKNLVDVDLDDDVALRLADMFLPDTGFVTGRATKPRSHRFYVSMLSRYHVFKDPSDNATVFVEVRGDKRQTVMPPSLHPSGELYESYGDADPLAIDEVELVESVVYLAIATLLAKTWPDQGGRHEFVLAASALLARNGVREDTARKIVHAATTVAGDPEQPKRLAVVDDTYEKWDRGDDVTGKRAIEDAMTKPVAEAIKKWLVVAYGKSTTPLRAAGSEYSDFAMALEILADEGDSLAYVPQWKRWLRFNGVRWVGEELAEARQAVFRLGLKYKEKGETATLRADRDKFTALAGQLHGGGRSATLMRVMADTPEFHVDASAFDTNPTLLGTPSGVVDLTTGQPREARATDYVTKAVKYDPVPGPTPFVDNYIMMMANGNQAVADYLWRAFAYSITAEMHERCIFILSGTGRNGKSLLFKSVGELLGDYAASVSPAVLMKPDDDRPMPGLAKLRGARFVFTSESDEFSRFNASLIKRLSGGDVLNVRDLYEKETELVPSFKLWIATNDKPEASASDDALWDRIRLVPIEHKFPANREEAEELGLPFMKDSDVLKAVDAEGPAFLAKLVSLVPTIAAAGLKTPDTVTAATVAYRDEQDTVSIFVGDWLEVTGDETDSVQTSVMYEAYVTMCRSIRATPVSRVWLGRKLADYGVGRANSGVRKYVGVKLAHRAGHGFVETMEPL